MNSTASGYSDFTTATKTVDQTSWQVSLVAFHVLNIFELLVTVWILISMILFGTKTRRWRKTAGSSSLNSGIIYSTCTAAVALFVPRTIIFEIIYASPAIHNGDEWCNRIYAISNLLSALSTYASYFFLWLLQRIIYDHPYVKPRLEKWSIWACYFVLVLLTGVAIALCCVYVVYSSYEFKTYACVYGSHNASSNTNYVNLLLAASLVLAELLVLGLSIYPVLRVKFGSSQNLDVAPQSEQDSESQTKQKSRFNCCHIFRKDGPKSPIEMSARRAVICGIIMVVSDVITLLPAGLAFDNDSPALLRDAVFNIGSFVNTFCMIATFGFAGPVLTMLFPSCPRHKSKHIGSLHGSATSSTYNSPEQTSSI